MPEIVEFVDRGAASITPAVVEKLLRHLPQWKLEFTQIHEPLFPHLADQLEFLANSVEDTAEGAGQDLLAAEAEQRDASGNVKLRDIGLFMREKIETYFKSQGIPIIMRYFDPSYIIRSVAADAEDAILCDLFARGAVHAAMAGKTGLIIGLLHDKFIHVPIEMVVKEKKRLNPHGSIWQAVLAATGQPAVFE